LEKIEMKKTLVALAAFSAVAAFAQTTDGKPGVQIQGNFNAGYQANSWKGVKVSGFDQNGAGTSQINIRALEDLGGGMSAYVRMENDLSLMNNATNQGVLPSYATNTAATSTAANTNQGYRVTTGAASTWGNGELAVGLRTPMGDVAFGALNNAGLNYIQATAAALQGTSFGGGYGMVLGADPTLSSVRWANSFRYMSPTVEGFTGSFIYAPRQDSASGLNSINAVAATTTSLGVGLNNQVGAKELGLKYAKGPLTAGLVFVQTSLKSFCASPSQTAAANLSAPNSPCTSAAFTAGTGLATNTVAPPDASQDNKQSSLALAYDMPSGLRLSGAYQKTSLGQLGTATGAGNQSDRSAFYYQVTYTTGAHTAFASAGSVKEGALNNTKNTETSRFVGWGYNYALSKNTALVARYETFTDNANVLGNVLTTGPNAYSMMSPYTTSGNVTRVRSQFGFIQNF
jgi:predicted porin